MRIGDMWAVVWEGKGGVSVLQVRDLLAANSARFAEHDPNGGYAVLAIEGTVIEANAARERLMHARQGLMGQG